MAEWAADETKSWEVLEFDQYGLHAKLQVKTMARCTTRRARTVC